MGHHGYGREIACGKQIGYRRIVRLDAPVTAKVVRIEIESDGKASLHLSLRKIPPQDGSAASGNGQSTPKTLQHEIAMASGGDFLADFGKVVALDGFAFTPGEGSRALPKGYVAYVSDDAKAWRVVSRGEFGNILANPVRQDVRFDKPVSARYVKLDAVPFPDVAPDWTANGGSFEFFGSGENEL